MHADVNCDASLSVEGGSLTATVSAADATYHEGIRFIFGGGFTDPGTPRLTISNHAIVWANGEISENSNNSDLEVGADSTKTNGGIVFNGDEGTVYGNVTLQKDLTISEGESLDIPNDASLTIPSGTTLTNEGTVTNSDTLTNNGTINNSGTLPDNIQGTAPPSITTTSLDDGAENAAYTATLAADGEPTSWTWSADTNSSLPPGLALSTSGVISGTPTTQGRIISL